MMVIVRQCSKCDVAPAKTSIYIYNYVSSFVDITQGNLSVFIKHMSGNSYGVCGLDGNDTGRVDQGFTGRVSSGIPQTKTSWWYTYPSEKYESQLGWLFPMYGKKKCSKPPTRRVFR